MNYNRLIDPYSMERWILERHNAVIRTAEVRSRVGIAEIPPRRLSIWLASSLRHLADKLDGRTYLQELET